MTKPHVYQLRPPRNLGEGVTLFKLHHQGLATFEMGAAWVPAGAMMPEQGYLNLPAHDMTIFFKGRVEGSIQGENFPAKAGELIYLPPNVNQRVFFPEDSLLLYFLFGPYVDQSILPRGPGPENTGSTPLSFEIASLETPGQVNIKTLFTLTHPEFAFLEVGTVKFKAGDRIPREGYASITAHDMAVILKGRVEVEINSHTLINGPGEIVYMPPRARQKARFLEDTELVYIFFGEEVKDPTAAVQP